jgi:hypothetical protein
MPLLTSAAAHLPGVKLAPRSISVAVTDFVAEPLATLTMPVRCARQPLSVIADIVEDGVRHCVADAGLRLAEINGICVGVPGGRNSRYGNGRERHSGVTHGPPSIQHAPHERCAERVHAAGGYGRRAVPRR